MHRTFVNCFCRPLLLLTLDTAFIVVSKTKKNLGLVCSNYEYLPKASY